jgi:hypothetical protein
MAEDFDKFAWLDAVRDDERLPVGVRYVLQNVALVYVLHDGDGMLYARQSTIVDRLKVSARLVKAAYADARRLGYLVLVAERRRGRGQHWPDTYQLRMPPEIGARFAPISEEIGARNDQNRCTKRQKKVHETSEIGARADALTSENYHIKGEEQGIKKGGEEGYSPPPPSQGQPKTAHPVTSVFDIWSGYVDLVNQESEAAIPVEPPSRFCQRHPAGTDDPCRPCGQQRVLRENWDEEHALFMEWLADIHTCPHCNEFGQYTNAEGLWWCEHPKNNLVANSNCSRCDGYGWRLGLDRTPVEPAMKCDHKPPGRNPR